MEENYFSGRSEFVFKARNFDDKSKKLFKKYNKTRKHLKKEKARLKILKKKVESQATFFGFTFGGDEDKQALASMQSHVDTLKDRLKKQKSKWDNNHQDPIRITGELLLLARSNCKQPPLLP